MDLNLEVQIRNWENKETAYQALGVNQEAQWWWIAVQIGNMVWGQSNKRIEVDLLCQVCLLCLLCLASQGQVLLKISKKMIEKMRNCLNRYHSQSAIVRALAQASSACSKNLQDHHKMKI